MKVIFHIDIDSYFVSAHRSIDPRLINKPVAITDIGKGSIIAAASYEARQKGVDAAMPFAKALVLMPEIIQVQHNRALYTTLSTKFFDFISENYSKKIEIASIDECFVDVSDIWRKYGSPKILAKHIQNAIMQELRLPVSIGVSSNKFVAKMSTDVNKPFGITITKPEDFLKFFENYSLSKFYGIGSGTCKKLEAINIRIIGDLAKAEIIKVENILGNLSQKLIDNANGKGDDEIDVSKNELKSIGNEITFQNYYRQERKDVINTYSHLVSMISTRAKNRNVVGSTITVHFVSQNESETKKYRKQISLDVPTNDYDRIFEVAIDLFDKMWNGIPLKHIGVQLGKLTNMFENSYQTSLFDKNKEKTEVEKLIDKINDKFESRVVITGKERSLQNRKDKNQSRFIENDWNVKHLNKK